MEGRMMTLPFLPTFSSMEVAVVRITVSDGKLIEHTEVVAAPARTVTQTVMMFLSLIPKPALSEEIVWSKKQEKNSTPFLIIFGLL